MTKLTHNHSPVCRSLANILLIFISKTAKYQKKPRVTMLTPQHPLTLVK